MCFSVGFTCSIFRGEWDEGEERQGQKWSLWWRRWGLVRWNDKDSPGIACDQQNAGQLAHSCLKKLRATLSQRRQTHNTIIRSAKFFFHLRDFYICCFVLGFFTGLKWVGFSWKKRDVACLLQWIWKVYISEYWNKWPAKGQETGLQMNDNVAL